MVIASISIGLLGLFFGVYFGLYKSQICREENTQLRILLGRVLNSRFLQLYPPLEESDIQWDQIEKISIEEWAKINFAYDDISLLTRFVDKCCPYVLTLEFPERQPQSGGDIADTS